MTGMPFEFLEVSVKDGQLTLDAAGSGGLLKASAAEVDLYLTEDNSTIRFVRDATKKVVKLKAEFMSMPFEGSKVQ
jgi:cytochrome c